MTKETHPPHKNSKETHMKLTKEIKECSEFKEFKEFKERTQIPNFTNLAKFFNGFWWVLVGSDGDFSLRPNRYQLPTRTHQSPQEPTPHNRTSKIFLNFAKILYYVTTPTFSFR